MIGGLRMLVHVNEIRGGGSGYGTFPEFDSPACCWLEEAVAASARRLRNGLRVTGVSIGFGFRSAIGKNRETGTDGISASRSNSRSPIAKPSQCAPGAYLTMFLFESEVLPC